MAVTASNTAEPSEIAGRFHVVQKLGAGAFGTVYKARDTVLGRMLAIKTIRMEGLAASTAGLGAMLDRFKREAQVAAQLKHPNIVTIYDIGESEGLSYISMEFIDGIGLDRILAETGRLPLERAVAVAAQVADALDFAHGHGVIHRDIKPANIMIESGDRVKVTDFGIAKPTDSAEHLTMTGSLLGTPSYMSPEQARGVTLDGRSDLFSLGCVVYEMVAGRKAFRGESITALLFKIIAEEPPPIRQLAPSVPDAMAGIIARALAKAPDARYQTGRALADDLLALTRPESMPTVRAQDITAPAVPGDASSASAPTVEETAATRKVAPPPTTVLTPAAPTVGQPTAPAIPTPRAARPTVARAPRPAAEKRRGGLGLLLVVGVVAAAAIGAVGLGAWFHLARRGPEAPTTTIASPTSPEAAPGAPVEVASAPAAVATSPLPENVTSGPSAAEAASSTSLPPSDVAATAPPPGPPTQTSSAVPAPPPASVSAPPATDYSYLDAPPQEGSQDGRALGDEVARKYRSGGSTGISGRRFTPRPRFPRGLAAGERPAVGTLAYLLRIEERHNKVNGRYATLQELEQAGLLRLDVPFTRGVFERKGYRFRLTANASEFTVTATPLLRGRPFIVDDSGFVRVDD